MLVPRSPQPQAATVVEVVDVVEDVVVVGPTVVVVVDVVVEVEEVEVVGGIVDVVEVVVVRQALLVVVVSCEPPVAVGCGRSEVVVPRGTSVVVPVAGAGVPTGEVGPMVTVGVRVVDVVVLVSSVDVVAGIPASPGAIALVVAVAATTRQRRAVPDARTHITITRTTMAKPSTATAGRFLASWISERVGIPFSHSSVYQSSGERIKFSGAPLRDRVPAYLDCRQPGHRSGCGS